MTNTGTKLNKQVADVPNFGQVWYADWAIANIFGFHDLKQKFHITYDSDIEDAFHIHMPDSIVKFQARPNGLYTFKPSERYLKHIQTLNDKPQMIESNFLMFTVAENCLPFTTHQFERVK